MREAAQELRLIVALALAGFLGASFHSNAAIFFGASAAVYLGWHMVNIIRLVHWLGHSRIQTPFAYGIWERIFDGLQAIELRSRKRTRELRGFVRRLRRVIGGLAEATVLLDDRGHVRWFNPAAKRLLGLDRRTALKRPIFEFVDHPLFVEQMSAPPDFDPIDIPSPVNGAIILRVELSELEGTDQRLLIARDITRTHNLARSRKDFVANVSHELRTPLTVFRGYLEALAEDLEQSPDLAVPIAHLKQQSTRMQDLVDDLLDLSRLESTSWIPLETEVNVPDLIHAIVEDARSLDEAEDHEIIEKIASGLRMKGNAGILRTAFSNLVFNAVRHTNPGTRVVVEWRQEDGDAVLQVRDNGQGIATHHLPRLTERFYRVNSSRSYESGGTGLGLAIVRHALERHGSDLQIESAPGQGSCFTCRFASHLVVGTPRREAVRVLDVRPHDSRPH